MCVTTIISVKGKYQLYVSHNTENDFSRKQIPRFDGSVPERLLCGLRDISCCTFFTSLQMDDMASEFMRFMSIHPGIRLHFHFN